MQETPVFSVTEISLALKSVVEQTFSNIKVRGEVTGVKRASSGHIYFTLKDTDSVLSAIAWRGRSRATNDAIQEGLEIIATGKISTYPGRSSYQIIVDTAEPAGEGALLKLLKDRKEKLEKEGLFDPARKKPLPYLPRTIGVITSPTGAVIRDIMHRLNDRFPTNVILWPVLVQGPGAAEQISAAIRGFNELPLTPSALPARHSGQPDDLQSGALDPESSLKQQINICRPDLIIVARGGGSLEDLWPFNEEIVVRAAASSRIPLISAVGHETDTTLIDYAADKRAPTPTGAAEMAVPVRSELVLKTQKFGTRLAEGTYRTLAEKSTRLTSLSRGLPNLGDLINVFLSKLDDKTERLANAIRIFTQNLTQKCTHLARLLNSFSYAEILKRGFALVFNDQKELMTTAVQAGSEPTLTIQFADASLPVNPIPDSSLRGTLEQRSNPDSPNRKVDEHPTHKKRKNKSKSDGLTNQLGLFDGK